MFMVGIEMVFEVFGVYVAAIVATAWVTLAERKVLASGQWRKGPNKVRWKGVAQPLADAIKLFSKQGGTPYRAKSTLFLVSPLFSLVVSLVIWHL